MAKGLTSQEFMKLERYLDNVVSMEMNVLKRKGKEIKEVILEYANGRKFVADINNPNFKFQECTQLRSIERSVARGNFGKWNYQGNCGYALPKKFIEYVKGKLGHVLLADEMEGSGTVRELCQTMHEVSYYGNDLRYGFDFLNDDTPVFPNARWLHVPYFVGRSKKFGKLSRMPQYSGVQWGTEAHKSDGSHIHDWDEYIKWLNCVQARAIRDLRKGGYLGLLVGSSRVDGALYDPYKDMDFYGELESVIIKEQFNTMSDNVTYSNQNFIPICHEYLFVIRKKDNLIIPCRITKKVEVNLMNSTKVTWKELIANILETLGGIATKEQLVDIIKNHPKSKTNNFLDKKISQTVTLFKDIFERVDTGVYALKSVSESISSQLIVTA